MPRNPTPMHALHRAVADMTLGVAQSTRKREARDREMGFREVQQQYQIEIAGEATGVWGFAETSITFDYPFFYAPAQRDSDLDRPHFWFGAELDFLGAVSAVVTAWDTHPRTGAITGATVAVGVVTQAGAEVGYQGVVHLTFQGFAALSEDETDVEE